MALPKYMMEGDEGVWQTSENGLAWVRTVFKDLKAGMQFGCFEQIGTRVAFIRLYFDKAYPRDAQIMFLGGGPDELTFEPISEGEMYNAYEVKPLHLGINMLYGSPDNAVFPIAVISEDSRDAYAFFMNKASEATKSVLRQCGAVK